MAHARDLVTAWRERAEGMRRYAPMVACAFDDAAQELEAALGATDADCLTLQEAARESGYSPDHLGRLLKNGQIENVGRKHAPRIRRGDLPRKPPTRTGPRLVAGSRIAAIRRDVRDQHGRAS